MNRNEDKPAPRASRSALLLRGPAGRSGFVFHDGFNQPIHRAAPGLLGLLEARRVMERWKPATVHWMDDGGHFFNHILDEFAGVPQFEPVAVEIAAIRRMDVSRVAKNRCLFHYVQVLAGALERELSDTTVIEPMPVPPSVRDVSLNGTWAAYYRDDGGDYVERAMQLPVNWELVPMIANHAGSMRFTKAVEVPAGFFGKRVHLSFLGVDYYADVWVNGHHAGGHEGCFAPFHLDISSLLEYGERNLIRVTVTSPNEPAGEGTHVSSGWDDFRARSSFPNRKTLIKGTLGHHDAKRGGAWSSLTSQDANTGGVWNDVKVGVRNQVHLGLSGPKVTTLGLSAIPGSEDLTASVEVVVPVHNATAHTVQARVLATFAPANFEGPSLELKMTAALDPGASSLTLADRRLGPVRVWQPWDQGLPHLYSVRSVIEVEGQVQDEHVLETGLRTLAITPIGESTGAEGAFVVNGSPIFVRGTNLLPTYWLSEYSAEKVADDLRLLCDAGFNAVMIHALVLPHHFYSAANRLGVLVVQMFPLQWSYEQSLEFVERANQQVRDLAELLYNEPSVVSYETHNEPDMRVANGLDNREVDLQLHATFREADPHRWATTCSGGNHAYPGQFYELRDDNSFATLPARFEHAEFQGQRISRHRNMPTEFGIQAMPNVELFEELLAEDRVKGVLRRLRTDPKWRSSAGASWEEAEETIDAARKLLGAGSWNDALQAFDWRSLWRFDELKHDITEGEGSGALDGGVKSGLLSKRWALLLLEVLHYGAFKGENFWFGRWKPARSLAEFVQSSQDRQYRLHKEAIETYMNAGVLGPIVGYFSFMFRDSDRQAPTWGVVDADGVPKKAYRAYVESNQPRRVSLPRALQRAVKLPGDPWFGAQPGWHPPVRQPWTEAELIVANDTSEALGDGRISIWVEDAAGTTVPLTDDSGREVEGLHLEVDVEARSGFSYFDRYADVHRDGPPSRWVVPQGLAGGTYYLKAKLVAAAGEVLSTNSYELIVPDTTFPELGDLTVAQLACLLDGRPDSVGFHYWEHGRVTYRAQPGVAGFLAGFGEARRRGIDLYETTQGEHFFRHLEAELEGLDGSSFLLEAVWLIRSEILSPAEKTAVLLQYLETFGTKADEHLRARKRLDQNNEEE